MHVQRHSFSAVARQAALYVDKKVIVINKPPGVISQASLIPGGQQNSVDGMLDDFVMKLGLSSRPLPVHRLDKCTTGALLLARTPHAARDLSQQFHARTVHKSYLALVRAGRRSFPAERRGDIDARLEIEDGRVCVSNSGKEARTTWELVASSPHAPLSLLRLTLHTGVKHQLRVHLASVLRAPILGDAIYSRSPPSQALTGAISIPANRLFLHASHIAFFRYRDWGPRKRFHVGVTAPLPEDFADVCRQADLTPDARELQGGVAVDGQPAAFDAGTR